jgi:hypothetical protein
MAFQLTPYNNVALTASTPLQLTAGPGHYNLTLVSAEVVYIKNANTVSASDAASFPIPANVPVTITIWGPTGIWVVAAAAGNVGALLTPRVQ